VDSGAAAESFEKFIKGVRGTFTGRRLPKASTNSSPVM
jgi:hypothetical protein